MAIPERSEMGVGLVRIPMSECCQTGNGGPFSVGLWITLSSSMQVEPMLALAQAAEFRNNHQPLVCVSGTDRANGFTDSLTALMLFIVTSIVLACTAEGSSNAKHKARSAPSRYMGCSTDAFILSG